MVALTPPPPEKLLTAAQVADRLAIAVRTLWRKLAVGELPPPDVRMSRKLVRWKESTIAAFLASQGPARQGGAV